MRILDLLDDGVGRYWTVQEVTWATYEGLRVFGAFTSYWRARGAFNVDSTSPYADLAGRLPALRPRTFTLDQMVREIQYMLLENPGGIGGAGMSGQVSVQSILDSIQIARNRFVQDTCLPVMITPSPNVVPPEGLVEFDQKIAYLHRASWQDGSNQAWKTLWREDAWSQDHNNINWTVEPGNPLVYSQAEASPLKVQLVPPPANSGVLEVIGVETKQVDIADPLATFDIPDEWIHAVKYAALSQILSSEGQIKDPMRGEYCEQRYKESVDVAKTAKSVIRVLLNGKPIPLDAITSIDLADPGWRNNLSTPRKVGVLFDLLVFTPCPPQQYGVSADVVQAAPLPLTVNDFIQLGEADMDALTDYVSHILVFKCGGKEFTGTMSGHDSFMENASTHRKATSAQVRYLKPLFSQWDFEQSMRKDK